MTYLSLVKTNTFQLHKISIKYLKMGGKNTYKVYKNKSTGFSN